MSKNIIPSILLCIPISAFSLSSFASEPHTQIYFINDLSCSYAAAPEFVILYKSVIMGPSGTTTIPYEVSVGSNVGILLGGVNQACQE